ncbi:hypothetical protein JI435_419380 [Parastagonospora nodorum SN15]|uniref:Uncharacterized protein n=1 Tax=Phaeosphaeria nodorum (strain SN15 / ATCC MYA-4574 / FGSC 10173) TaxID=321614 RepID=A0A7U2FFJ6_PHANO|nr:hypothetical protein JI435_419380 [Parastagonospora nodorum SN15]
MSPRIKVDQEALSKQQGAVANGHCTGSRGWALEDLGFMVAFKHHYADNCVVKEGEVR